MQQQEQPSAAPSPTEGQQQAQAAMVAAAANAVAAQQAATLAAMLPPGVGGTPGARPALALHPALAAMTSAGLQGGMLPVGTSPAAFAALAAARPGMPGQPFFFPAVPMPQPMAQGGTPSQQLPGGTGQAGASVASLAGAAAAAAAAAARRPGSRPSSRSSSGAGKKHCNCKNSRCLKLYCECFASGRYCDGCNCLNCYNNREHEATRQAAVEAILERNPNAFRPKIAGGADSRHAGGARHNKGCNCKKSGCLKKYCECFQAGIVCSDNCKCLDCKNYEGSEARDALVSPQAERQGTGSPMGLRGSAAGRPSLPSISPVPLPPGSAGLPGLLSPGAQSAAAGGALGQQMQQSQASKLLTEEEKQEVAREAMQEVIKPEVVEKLAMLLMVVSQEEQDQQRRQQQQAPGVGSTDAAAAMEVDEQQQQQQPSGPAIKAEESEAEGMEVDAAAGAAAPGGSSQQGPAPSPDQEQRGSPPAVAGANGVASQVGTPGAGDEGGQAGEESVYQAQERAVLTEFRDALQMISRVVGEKVDKKVAAAQQQAQQLLLPPMPVPQPAGTPSATPGGLAGMLGALALPSALKPGGVHPGAAGMFMAATPGQHPQLVAFLPPGLMAQQFAAAGQHLTLLPTSQGLQAVVQPAGEQGAVAGVAASQPAQQQQQQQQLVPAAGAGVAVPPIPAQAAPNNGAQ